MILRLSKAFLVLQIALFALLVGIDNIVDYGTNYAFVHHVLTMDTTFPDSQLRWRAITSPALHAAAYWAIIAAEIATGLLCLAGAARLFGAARAPAAAFNAAKGWAVAGLTLGFTLWFTGFMTVGAEWFQMWQSATWNGQAAAFRFIACIGIVLVLVAVPDGERADART